MSFAIAIASSSSENEIAEHGAEDLLARDLVHLVRHGVEDRRLDVVAARLLADARAAEVEPGALVLPVSM